MSDSTLSIPFRRSRQAQARRHMRRRVSKRSANLGVRSARADQDSGAVAAGHFKMAYGPPGETARGDRRRPGHPCLSASGCWKRTRRKQPSGGKHDRYSNAFDAWHPAAVMVLVMAACAGDAATTPSPETSASPTTEATPTAEATPIATPEANGTSTPEPTASSCWSTRRPRGPSRWSPQRRSSRVARCRRMHRPSTTFRSIEHP